MKSDFNFSCLASLVPGQSARVQSVEGEDTVARRLRALGFRPDTPVRVLRRAPMGDPVVYELRGYRLCLRAAEARRIRVSGPA